MSGKKDPNGQWRQTSVVVRSDIFLKAAEMGLDISDELNQRLAELVGIDYRQQRLTGRPITDRAIYAADTAVKEDAGMRQKPQFSVLYPVINADDPAAASKVRKAKRLSPKPVPVASPLPETDISPEYSGPKVQRVGGKSADSKKKRKDDMLKKFVTTKITRVDADDAVISKEDMYQAFTRWCRDHRIAPVPERKVFTTLLKNKFAITEKTVSGTSCWVNVRLG